MRYLPLVCVLILSVALRGTNDLRQSRLQELPCNAELTKGIDVEKGEGGRCGERQDHECRHSDGRYRASEGNEADVER